MLVIPVNKVMDPKRIIGKWRAEEEEWHKGSLTPPPKKKNQNALGYSGWCQFLQR
jgi:hypothetical protein